MPCGGVALNAKMNRYLADASSFARVFIQPAAGDAGVALGAALAADPPCTRDKREPLKHVYLGPKFDDAVIARTLERRCLSASCEQDICQAVASLLARGKIVGWFQDRMEFGPRALGARSILADPRRAEMKDILNRRVKHREPFRPFAPAVAARQAAEYFDAPGECPFMVQTAPVTKKARELIPAVVHEDGTARIQTVTPDSNPLFYRLIEEFRRLTNIPVVVNTSFNVRGEPIVCTPDNALDCYLHTQLDALAMGRYLLIKNSTDC